ncbi:signal peptidase I [Candidatus Woesearchaeota archaeon]|jgi:signal peptidase I|nr:signal peptidase I [Candidatus Woesearchaeota archaeon]MBT7928890.1 signal peptidase I [Candidatus Peregrinibacteria bacterium]MBT3537630.1 signal peptidase I [Candidatus Woesearchaeota archaeon]MBT4698436.1 signal peptidase I [Candidatus Woesearchaeota archaeon]MBT4716655.1 signal peptidase I [Candidatus Woesearchaeota archaeon]
MSKRIVRKKRVKPTKSSTRSILSWIWYILWEDDSWYSWIISAVVAFILIKFVVYPVLGFIVGTGFPIVAVVSSSMEHPGGFDSFWEDKAFCREGLCTQGEYYNELSITREGFREFPFKNGFNKGDIMLLYGRSNIDVGDVIVFMSRGGQPIIHRVVAVSEKDGKPVYQTKGDNNEASIKLNMLNEYDIPGEVIIGEAKARVPFLGYVKIGFVWLLEVLQIM